MSALRLGSLCTGYGGLDAAVGQVLDVETVWHADPDLGAAAILAHHWPHVPNLGDITSVDWEQVQPVDVLAAGFPCQDVSLAGRRAGISDGTRSGLWAHVARAISVLRPRLVVIENVRGLLSASADGDVEPCAWCVGDPGGEPPLRALGAVLGDLARLGLDAQWASVRASDVGACHQRERVFLLAWTADTAGAGLGARREGRPRGAAPAHPDGGGLARYQERDGGPQPRQHSLNRLDAVGRGVQPAPPNDWGTYGPAIRRWEQSTGRAAPAPTEPGRTGNPRLSPHFVEWLMGLPDGHVTGVPGLTRTQQLRALGNGVVPQQGAAAVRLLLDRAELAASLEVAA